MRLLSFLGLALIVALVGCHFRQKSVKLPAGDRIVRDQLVIYCDFDLPRRHRLLDELTAQRSDMTSRLNLPVSDEPINIYLFDNAPRYEAYMAQHHPDFPDRRAFFVKNDTTLTVFAHWGEHVAEDLRHEVGHGYLHSVVPNLPLWLDEGVAEYFEVARGRHGINYPHIKLLKRKIRGKWKPDLSRLERLMFPDEMTQLDYAEAWLWVHFMIESHPQRLKLLQDHLARLRIAGEAPPLSQVLAQNEPQSHRAVVHHLQELIKLNR